MKVIYFSRRARSQVYYSVEKTFGTSLEHLPPDVSPELAISRFESRGVFKRLYNLVEAAFRQGDVNHITGDVHYLAYLLRKRKTVLTVLDCNFETRPPGWRRSLLLWLWYILPVRRSAVITAISEFTKNRLVHHTNCDPDKVHVVPVCISTTFRRIDKPFNADRPTILHVGTKPNKNLDRLVEALKGVKCRLQIVGVLSPDQRAMLDASGVEYANAHGLSEDELLDRYAACDVLAFVSTYEGFGMPIVEANTVGRPVVTSNITSIPEVARDAACLVDPFDVGSIREGILKVIKNSAYRERLVRNGFENCRRFLPGEVARQYADLYYALVDDSAAAEKRVLRSNGPVSRAGSGVSRSATCNE